MTKILITNPNFEHSYECEANQGLRAIMLCTIASFRKVIPHAEISTVIQFSQKFVDQNKFNLIKNNIFRYRPYSFWESIISNMNLTLAGIWNIFNSVHADFRFILQSRKLKAFYKADVIIHLGTNLYGEDFGIRSFIEHSKEILLAKLLKKKIVMFAESIGPFNSSLTRSVARSLLNKVDLITLRDPVSQDYLKELNVTVPPIYLTADPAFLLEPAPAKRVAEILKGEGIKTGARPVIGVVLSSATNLKQQSKKSRMVGIVTTGYSLVRYFMPEFLIRTVLGMFKRIGYLRSFQSKYVATQPEETKLLKSIAEKLDADILIIPHIHQEGVFADTETVQQTQSTAGDQERIQAIKELYLSEELKGIIGKCDLLISSRMHAAIAAMSQGIPTILIPVSQRHHGIMRMTGLERYVCKSFTREEILPRVEDVWQNRESIKAEMNKKIDDIKKSSLRNFELVNEL